MYKIDGRGGAGPGEGVQKLFTRTDPEFTRKQNNIINKVIYTYTLFDTCLVLYFLVEVLQYEDFHTFSLTFFLTLFSSVSDCFTLTAVECTLLCSSLLGGI